MQDLVRHLQNEFSHRCRNNEQYSLRAFARSLSLPVSTLSELLNKKRPVSKKTREKIGRALGLQEEEIKLFRAKDHGNRQTPLESTEVHYKEMALDSFYIISEWFHYGILQLMKTDDFVNDHHWVGKRLGIKPLQVKLAFERLKRVGLVEESDDGTLIDVTQGHSTHLRSDFTNDELRNFQIRALEKAIESLKSVPISMRDNTSMTFAVNKEAIPFAKEEIKKFRRSLTKKLEAYGQPDEVYQLAISLTPLTNISDNRRDI